MKKKEIKEKFEKLDEQIKSLERGQEDLCEVNRFILTAMRRYTDEPIYRVRNSNTWQRGVYAPRNILQYAYNSKVSEIETDADIRSAELFAYCNTHFILKNLDNECFLVDMGQKTITNIPLQLLLSKEMNFSIEGQTFTICHEGPGVIGVRHV